MLSEALFKWILNCKGDEKKSNLIFSPYSLTSYQVQDNKVKKRLRSLRRSHWQSLIPNFHFGGVFSKGRGFLREENGFLIADSIEKPVSHSLWGYYDTLLTTRFLPQTIQQIHWVPGTLTLLSNLFLGEANEIEYAKEFMKQIYNLTKFKINTCVTMTPKLQIQYLLGALLFCF